MTNIYWRATFDVARFDKKDEEGILQEVTVRVQEMARDIDLLEIRRVDIRNGKAIVFLQGKRPEDRTAARGIKKERTAPEGFEEIEEKEVLALP